jgi:hypothetical protein
MLNQIAALHGTGVAASTTSYESIATVSLGSTQSTISFTSIPSTYKHLQIRGIARTNRAVTFFTPMVIQFNADTTAGNYYFQHILVGDTSAAAAYATASSTTAGGMAGDVSGGSGVADTFAANVIDILDYQNTNKFKTLRSLSGSEGQTSNLDNEIKFGSSLWKSTSAITQIDLKVNSGDSFVQYSQFALYGIKG